MSLDLWTQIITAASTLAAAGLGGLVVWLATSRQLHHQSQADAQRRFVEKMECLHGEITRLQLKVAQFRIDMYKKVDATELERYILDPAQLTMLTDFYAPALRLTINSMSKALNELSVAVYNVHSFPEATPDELVKLFATANDAFENMNKAAGEAKLKLRESVGPLTDLG
jgi:hypothetical protein